jgi:hypothetical protein
MKKTNLILGFLCLFLSSTLYYSCQKDNLKVEELSQYDQMMKALQDFDNQYAASEGVVEDRSCPPPGNIKYRLVVSPTTSGDPIPPFIVTIKCVLSKTNRPFYLQFSNIGPTIDVPPYTFCVSPGQKLEVVAIGNLNVPFNVNVFPDGLCGPLPGTCGGCTGGASFTALNILGPSGTGAVPTAREFSPSCLFTICEDE